MPTTGGGHKGAPGDVSVIVAPGNRVPLTSPALNPSKMALRSWTPDKGFISKKVKQPASVATSLSLEICSFPATLGSSVAAAALEQLLVVGEKF